MYAYQKTYSQDNNNNNNQQTTPTPPPPKPTYTQKPINTNQELIEDICKTLNAVSDNHFVCFCEESRWNQLKTHVPNSSMVILWNQIKEVIIEKFKDPE